ncbi:protein-L-isoaspartate O-methyltransferase [Chitiniphilus shinanonensis]|uniref:Protein-L-isoaspartate O-methyltransferase n=1 Tax=Chitiniphilus shinanonensis TaxID=553088 RepID=A0ABQ6BPU0_9NEIS|nr:protein-L-isoaspartate O-methyltransferase [Chitiniphilus shinanonensis]GLS03846.1 protein-L-isoaspartate O-methyltransferase [Chitiniphilus shinanonensis]
MDWEHARYLLVEQQIRPWEVLDQQVLQRVLAVKREDFVPQDKRNLAFVDTELPLGHGASMLSPKVEARLLQDVELKSGDKVLVVGAGTGYLVALAAGLCAQVYGVEIEPELKRAAEENLARAGIRNARIELGDGVQGLAAQAPFDAIIVTGSVAEVPQALKDQLAVGGRLIAVVGELPIMSATLLQRVEQNAWRSEKRFEYNLPRLKNTPVAEAFSF